MTSGVYFSPGDMVRRFSFSGRGNVNGWVLGTVLARREVERPWSDPKDITLKASYVDVEYLVLCKGSIEWVHSAFVMHVAPVTVQNSDRL